MTMRVGRIALTPLLVGGALALSAQTVVPPADRIDDRTATLALAETLSWRAETRAEALSLYERWLAAHPDDAEAIVAVARVETWSKRGAQAAKRLEALAERQPLSASARRVLAEAWTQTGRFDEAAGAYGALLAETPGDLELRRAQALVLFWSGKGAEARPLIVELSRELPNDQEIARALTALSGGDPGAAEKTRESLRERIARDPGDAAAMADLADLEAARGHAAAARDLYDAVRARIAPKPGDAFDLRHARARLTWGDFYPAEAAVRAALAENPRDGGLRAELNALLVSMDRFERAEAEALIWLEGDPGSEVAVRALVDIHRKRRDDAAVAVWSAKLPAAAGKPAAVDPASPAGRFAAAGREGVREEAFVRALTGGAEGFQAKGDPLPADVRVPEPAWRLAEYAGLYAAQGDFDLAIRCLRAARLADAEYFPAWLALAEFLAIAQQYDEADREFAELAKVFPTNRQVLLKQARALGWGRRYDDSLAAYARLHELNPADPVPLLEQARVAGWAKERGRAAELYAERWRDAVDARLFAGLAPLLRGIDRDGDAEVLQRWQSWSEEAPTHEEPFHFAERFEAERETLRAQVPPEVAKQIERLRLELRADFLLQRAFWLENEAKQLAWDRRWWRSEETYARLLAVAPGNQEALFDLSQVQAAQGLGDRERATLERLLALDANNRLAGQALFRRERRSEPLVFAQVDYYRERGRDDLSSIARLRGMWGGELTFDDRFKARAALVRWQESPETRGDDFYANGFTLGAEGVFTNWLTASAEYTHKDNDASGIGSVDTGGVQAWVPFKDAVRVGAGVEVREELANEFAYFQGIRSTHRWIGGEAALSRRAEVAARVSAIDYADDNQGTHVWIAPAYTWTEHPRTFKTTLTLEARDTDEANRYVFAGPTLVDIVHPYWTPQDYRGAALTLEWRHDLAREFFIGAQEHWYDVRVTFGVSNDDNQGVSWAADYAKEWRDRWVMRLGVAQTWSEQWDDFRALARLGYRF